MTEEASNYAEVSNLGDIVSCGVILYSRSSTLTKFFCAYSIMKLWKDCGCGCDGAIAKKRFYISMLAAAVFFVIVNANTYKLTRSIFGNWVATPGGCPTYAGFLLHIGVFILVTYLLMRSGDKKRTQDKLKTSLLSALIVYLVANPHTYLLTRSIFGNRIADAKGCPTLTGLRFTHWCLCS